MTHRKPPVPVNIVAGALGAGKTTVLNHLLSTRPAGERWAILVNEYGLVGLDAALMDDGRHPQVSLREVSGGCICCSAGLMFEMSLVMLLRQRPDRLLIEPTGLATLSGILDTLGREGIREAVDLRSVIALIDPTRLETSLAREEVRDQVEAADILLATRSDLAPKTALQAFEAWAQGLFPPKIRIDAIAHGVIEPGWLDTVRDRAPAPSGSSAPHGHAPGPEAPEPDVDTPVRLRHHRSPAGTTVGWIARPELVFEAQAVTTWISALTRLPGCQRTKAVLHTTEGWLAFNVAGDTKRIAPSGYRRDSRVEVVLEGDRDIDPGPLQDQLLRCQQPARP